MANVFAKLFGQIARKETPLSVGYLTSPHQDVADDVKVVLPAHGLPFTPSSTEIYPWIPNPRSVQPNERGFINSKLGNNQRFIARNARHQAAYAGALRAVKRPK